MSPTSVINSTQETKSIQEIPMSDNTNSAIKTQPLEGWIYEPKDVKYFWDKMGDRPFLRELYSHVGKFNRVLDVGARGYNRYCKELINSTTTQYFQMEPFPPSERSEMNNDGLLECYMQEAKEKYPDLKHSFDLVLDFGVFGWGAVQVGFDESDIDNYVESVRFLLNNEGIWVLKVDRNWVPNHDEFFVKYLIPHFDLGDFAEFHSGHSVRKGNFKFYFLHKK